MGKGHGPRFHVSELAVEGRQLRPKVDDVDVERVAARATETIFDLGDDLPREAAALHVGRHREHAEVPAPVRALHEHTRRRRAVLSIVNEELAVAHQTSYVVGARAVAALEKHLDSEGLVDQFGDDRGLGGTGDSQHERTPDFRTRTADYRLQKPRPNAEREHNGRRASTRTS